MSARLRLHTSRLRRLIRPAVRKAENKAAEHLLQVSQTRVPLEEGTLLRSGRVNRATAGRGASVSYGTVYAMRQHEELTWRHAPGRTAKYLEAPAAEEAHTMAAIAGREIRFELEHG